MRKEILQNLNILYAEDENDVRTFTTGTLETLVKHITAVEDGKVGLKTFQENPEKYNLIITDINMPKMNGLDMCMEIRKLNPEIPIVVTSAHSDENFLKKSIEVGVSSYSTKPIDLYQLVDSIVKAAEPQYLRDKLKKSHEEQIATDISSLEKVLNSQKNIIFVSDGINIDIVNKEFLNFFQVDSKEDFLGKNKNIYHLFLEESGVYSFNENERINWIEQIKNLSNINRIIKLKDPNDNIKTFIVNADTYEKDKDKYVISFTDITEIRKKSALLEYQANHDPLTGLLNRTAFDRIYSLELKRGIRYDTRASLIIFDIDNFKSVNDNYGHNIGDQVLKNIAKISQNSIRDCDCITRWGGEEFIVLLPETPLQGAVNVAQKIRKAIEEYNDNKTPKVTSSFGVSELKKDDTKESFIQRIDDALYEAKKTGKNKVVVK